MLILQIVAVAFVQGFSGRFMKISTTIIQTSCVSDKCWIYWICQQEYQWLCDSSVRCCCALVPCRRLRMNMNHELFWNFLAIISGQIIATREIPLYQAVHEVLIGFWRSCAASLVVWWVVFILPPYSYVMLKMVLHWLTFLLCMFTLITLHTKPGIFKNTFYTDGSSMFPQHLTTRFAASAVTIDLCEHDEQVSCHQLSRSLHKEEHWVSKISIQPSCQQSLLCVK